MAYFDRVGIIVVDEAIGKMLLLKEFINKKDITGGIVYQTIGGRREGEETDIECLAREVKEETNCETDVDSLVFLGEYIGPSVSDPAKDVSVRLYKGKIIGDIQPQIEEAIAGFVWMGKEVLDYKEYLTSHVLREKILPDLLARKIIW